MTSRTDPTISRERLNQIALRKLTSLGVPADVQPNLALMGEWPFRTGRLLVPGTQVRIPSARFKVEGHDRLTFATPPLSALGPLSFYDLDNADAFELRVARALSVRLGYLQSLAGQLGAKKVESRLDGNALVLRGEVETADHVFGLQADPEGIRVVSMRQRLGSGPPTPVSFPLALEEHGTRGELELFLANAVHRGELSPKTAEAQKQQGPELVALPLPQGALPAGGLARFGPGATVAVQDGKLVVSQALRLGAQPVQFLATHLGGTSFQGRILVGNVERWADRFDVARFPGVEQLARICLGVASAGARAPGQQAAPSEPGRLTLDVMIPPAPGELWVMDVLVEREADGDVRYSCADVDGRPYGATRVLRSEDFRGTFSPHGAGWRLRIVIERLEGDRVIYRQLNPSGERGPEKQLALATLRTIFVPSAQAM
jgi:hypothetical protein